MMLITKDIDIEIIDDTLNDPSKESLADNEFYKVYLAFNEESTNLKEVVNLFNSNEFKGLDSSIDAQGVASTAGEGAIISRVTNGADAHFSLLSAFKLRVVEHDEATLAKVQVSLDKLEIKDNLDFDNHLLINDFMPSTLNFSFQESAIVTTSLNNNISPQIPLTLDVGPFYAKGGTKGGPGDGGGSGGGGSKGGSGDGGKSKNTEPVVEEQTIHAKEDGNLVSGILTVIDPDATDTHTFSLLSGTSEGSVIVNSDGTFVFDPMNDFQDLGVNETRTVTFTVEATDSSGARNATSAPVTISVVVAGTNDLAVTHNDSYQVSENGTTSISAIQGAIANDIDIDGDVLSASVVSGPVNGVLSFNADGSFDYTHSGNGTTTDSFSYRVFDGIGYSNVATVSLDIVPYVEPSMQINLIDIGGAAPGSIVGEAFAKAASFWSSIFLDPIIVNLNVGFSALGPGILGSTSSNSQVVDYNSLRNALMIDQTSPEDISAFNTLSTGYSLSFYTNDPSGNYYFDSNGNANNTYFDVNTANLKALGLLSDESIIDGTVKFSSQFSFDFDSSDGVSSGTYDFVSIAVHEIGHALGFVSGVDVIDYYSGSGPGSISSFEPYAIFNTLDLFRYSSDSLSYGTNVQDLGYQDRGQFFSIDGGLTSQATFSTGTYNGDGRQASHWEDNLGLGIMDPTFSSGELGTITANDILAFDVIGYDLVNGLTEVPLFQQLDQGTLNSVSNLIDSGSIERSSYHDSINPDVFSSIVSTQFQDDLLTDVSNNVEML